MSKHGHPMSQTLAQMHLNELKMNDPKLNKVFDKLKPKATVQLKTSSTIAKGDDFKTYLVVSKNTLRNGVEKITLKNRANPTGVKSFLYRSDGSVTFAIGDMGASIDDIKEEVELDEGKMSQLHQHIKDGKSAKEIAKIMKLDVKTIKALMGEELKEGTWGLPDTPKLKAGLKKLMQKLLEKDSFIVYGGRIIFCSCKLSVFIDNLHPKLSIWAKHVQFC